MRLLKVLKRTRTGCLSERFVYALVSLIFVFSLSVRALVPDDDPEREDEASIGTLEFPVEVKVDEPEVVANQEPLTPNTTLQEILFRYNFEPQDVHQLIQETRAVYDLNRIQAGNQLTIETLSDGTFKSLRYQISDEEYLVASYDGRVYEAAREQVEFETKIERLYGVVSESLYATVKTLGEGDWLVAQIVEILQWDIDFTAMQEGDWFKVIVEKKYLEEDFVKYGRILAVQFSTGGKDFYGFLFEAPDGKTSYYDDKGNSVKKAFLRVPFHFSPRISSGFSQSRFHPILKKRRPHPAVDFAAPRGTPVLASASGRVVNAGWSGGLGQTVKIRHPNGYTTSYAHLSRILVKAGQAVQQGQSIGRVGSTGLATGAHLDYRIQDSKGRYLNPRKRIAWPSDKPVDPLYRSEFAAVREGFLGDLAAILTESLPASGFYKAD